MSVMNEDMRVRCAKIFGASKRKESLYVAGDKIFENVCAALSYSTQVEEVKREDLVLESDVSGASKGAEDKEKGTNKKEE